MNRSIIVIIALGAGSGCVTATPCASMSLRVSGGAVWAAGNTATEPRRVWRVPRGARVDAVTTHSAGGRCFVHLHDGDRQWRGELSKTSARSPLAEVPDDPAPLAPVAGDEKTNLSQTEVVTVP